MAHLVINHLDDPLYEKLKNLAEHHRQSIEAEVRDILQKSIDPTPLDSQIAKRFIGQGLKAGKDF